MFKHLSCRLWLEILTNNYLPSSECRYVTCNSPTVVTPHPLMVQSAPSRSVPALCISMVLTYWFISTGLISLIKAMSFCRVRLFQPGCCRCKPSVVRGIDTDSILDVFMRKGHCQEEVWGSSGGFDDPTASRQDALL